MPKAFTEHEKEIINRRLLEQGHKMFTAYGLRKTNVDEIASAAGISKGAFYGFYESKEALFLAVIEQVEQQVREQILAEIDRPGQSPRARLFAVLNRALSLFQTMPLLRAFSGSDYDLLFRRLPAEKLQQHLTGDTAFIDTLLDRCRSAGIPIQAPPEQIVQLLYPLVVSVLHEDDLGPDTTGSGLSALLELVTAYCLGDITLQLQSPSRPADQENQP